MVLWAWKYGILSHMESSVLHSVNIVGSLNVCYQE